MSWLSENVLSWTKKLGVNVMKCGPIPQHIAFIMDGNRRFARKKNQPTVHGHSEGFKKLIDYLQWLVELEVSEVTVYVFSIENFKRTKNEVDAIMGILREKLKQFLNDREMMKKLGLRICAIGNISLLPYDIISLLADLEEVSKENTNILLNLALAYTAQEEMTNAINIILQGVKSGDVVKNNINATLFNHCLYTRKSLPVELILRTSGEMRLSDFLLYQGSYSYLYFSKSLWPELPFWDFLWALFKYQRAFNKLEKARAATHHENYLTFNSVE